MVRNRVLGEAMALSKGAASMVRSIDRGKVMSHSITMHELFPARERYHESHDVFKALE